MEFCALGRSSSRLRTKDWSKNWPSCEIGPYLRRRRKPIEIGKHSNLREEMQKWASAAEYFQGLSMKCLLQLEEAASSIEAKKHELRAPGMQRPCWSQLVHVKARIRRCADFDSSYEESASLLAKLRPWHSHKK